MAHRRKLYYSRKAGKIVIEGIAKGKTIYIYSLPEPLKLLKSLNLTREKLNKIMEKIHRLDYSTTKPQNKAEKVRIIKITRNQKNNDKPFHF